MKLAENPERRLGGIDFILARGAEVYPNKTALDDRLNGVKLSYEQVRARASQLARALAQLGVGKGDRVAYAFYNEHPSIEAVFACCLLGAVAVPLNNRLSPAETIPYIDAQGCRVFMAREELAALGAETAVEHVVIRGGHAGGGSGDGALDYETLLAEQSGARLPPRARWEDPYILAMTGGTTGDSKAVVWTHGGCLMDTLTVIAHLGIGRNYNSVCYAPTYHAAGLGWAFLPPFWQGGTIIFPPTAAFSPSFFHDVLEQEEVHCLFLVPAMIGPIHKAWDGRPLTGVRSICIASAPTPKVLREKLAEIFPESDIVIGYGMTESFSITAQRPADFLAFPDGVGEPSLDARVRIVDDDGNILGPGETGQIVTRTLAMGLYYNNDPDNTAATFKTCRDDHEGLEWIHTGDVGRIDADGRVTIVDRVKDVIITGGENVASVQIETVLSEHPQVRECAVVGLPDERWGELVCAVVVKASEDLDDRDLAAELVASCRGRLGGYKIPKRLVFIDALPRSPFGKVLKRTLRETDFARVVEAADLKAAAG